MLCLCNKGHLMPTKLKKMICNVIKGFHFSNIVE